MEHLIRFALLNDELNDDEFNQFVLKCIKLKGRSLFKKALFIEYKQTPESIIPFTNIVTDIINSRESIPKQKITSLNMLDELPSELIAKCAAFLQTNEYVQFGHANRKIYTSIYYPTSTIQILSYNAFKNYPMTLSMNRFKNINELAISLGYYMNNLSLSNQFVWKSNNKLKTLRVNAGTENDMSKFLTDKPINLNNIEKLVIDDLDCDTISFCDLISHFPSIEYLQINQIYANYQSNQKHISKPMPNLKHFAHGFECDIANQIISDSKDQLESLWLCWDNFQLASSIHFPKLKELYLKSPKNCLLPILDKNTDLKRVIFESTHFNNDNDLRFDKNHIKQIIKKAIHKQLSLQYLKFYIYFELLECVMNQLEIELYSISNKVQKSNVLVLEFDIYGEWQIEWMNGMYVNVRRLISSVNSCKRIDDFHIKLKMKSNQKLNQETVTMQQWLTQLKIIKEDYCVNYYFTKNKRHEYQFSISNNDSKMDVDAICHTAF